MMCSLRTWQRGTLKPLFSWVVAVAACLLTMRSVLGNQGDCHASWDATIGQPGMQRLSATKVRTFATFNDGSGTALYAGGRFLYAGDVKSRNVARWDGTQWSSLGSGLNGTGVVDLAVFDDGSGDGPALYAGGNISNDQGDFIGITKWDPQTVQWTTAAGGLLGTVTSLLPVGDEGGEVEPGLYVGGSFSVAGGEQVNKIARWDGEKWWPLGSGVSGLFPVVQALQLFDDGNGPALYVGGTFSHAGGVPASHIARWDGESWSAVGQGLSARMYDFAVFDDGSGSALYAAGLFTMAGGAQANRVAKWDGEEWSSLGTGLNDTALALSVHEDSSGPSLYVGGWFTFAGGAAASRVAKWDGENWSPLGAGIDGPQSVFVLDLIEFDDGAGEGDDVFVGGKFSSAGGMQANHIAVWRTPLPTDPGDVNCDGAVNTADLIQLVSLWGSCNDCPEDIDEDGVVGTGDLLMLLANWG